MEYNFIINDENQRKILESYISFRFLKGFPCPFCHCNEVSFEKADFDNPTKVEVRVLCKYCRRVENYLTLKIENSKIIGAKNTRTCLHISDDLVLDMKDKKWQIIKTKYRKNVFELELEPFFINYMDISKLVDKIETLMVFR